MCRACEAGWPIRVGPDKEAFVVLTGAAEPPEQAARGVFDAASELFTRYRARMVFRAKLIGGIPRDPKLIEGWLRTKAGIDDAQEVREAMLRTLGELGVQIRGDMSFDEVVQASEALASRKQTTGFKVGEHGLYVEARQVKAMLKESTNVLFARRPVGPDEEGPPLVPRGAGVRPARPSVAGGRGAGRRRADDRPHHGPYRPAQHARLPRVPRSVRAHVHGSGGARLH